MSPLRLARLPLRLLHSSARTCNLVGPPDPISNIRPVLYDDAPDNHNSSLTTHPYSLHEFADGDLGDYEFQWKLHRQQLDSFHQNFWMDSNSRFEAGKQAVLSSLPESSTTLDREHALSEFYKQWVMQETHRTNAYTQEWRKRLVQSIALSIRVGYHRFMYRISDILTFKST